jgi:uncharacterized protein
VAVDANEFAADLAVQGPVEIRETHISWVFLTPERAFKLKKPLVLPFLDYGTPARRREMSAQEIRLNRRLAPQLYLGVRSVVRTPSGYELQDEDAHEAVDYVVEMRRYDEARTLAQTLDRGELRRSDIAEVARVLAQFHAECPVAHGPEFGARGIEREVDSNLEQLLGVAELRTERAQIRELARFLSAFVEAHWQRFEEREAQGQIRECHGDLRAEHVVLGDPLSVVDCVEFDPALRTLDVSDDLAYLVMELTAFGGERFADQLVDAYRAAGGDPGDDALLAFFAVHRALVRTKVLLVRAGQYPAGSAEHGRRSAQARALLDVARRFAWRARLPLAIVLCGVPASGKSHLARSVAEQSRMTRISSDLVRKGLAGIRATQQASQEHYREQFSRATYTELGRQAAVEVATRGGVIVDATFRHRRDRDAFADAFAGAAPLMFVECVAPEAVLIQRARAREQDPDRVSDADVAVVIRERGSWEPLDEVPADRHIVLRTDRAVEMVAADLRALLDTRL